MHRLVQKIKYSDKPFEDKDKAKKGVLTDFVDHYFLTFNDNQLRLMKLIYTILNPILKKHGLILVFKGGNVMRMINKNVMKYFPPNADDLIMDTFAPFLKQSDNDFTIFINPKSKKFEEVSRSVAYEVFMALDAIKKALLKNLPYFFNLFRLNDKELHGAFNALKKELGVKYIKLAPKLDQEIVFQYPNRSKSAVLVYENKQSVHQFLYNTINLALEFRSLHQDVIKFYLCRTKVNFQLNHSKNLGGELIDISIPHKKDHQMAQFKSTAEFKQFLADNIVKEHNDEYNFDYYVINVHYVVHDLFNILFVQNNNPWDDSKYNKRLARLLYFIFVEALNHNTPFSIRSIASIAEDYQQFIYQISSKKATKNHNHSLQVLADLTKSLNSNATKYPEYTRLLNHYAEAILHICNNIVQFLQGNEPINKNVLYELDVV